MSGNVLLLEVGSLTKVISVERKRGVLASQILFVPYLVELLLV